MNDGHSPTHESHLETENDRVWAVVAHDEFDGVAVRNPGKLHAPELRSVLIDRPVTTKGFAEI